MSRRATPAQAAHNQQIIKGLLKLDCNKICADCKRNKHPRWASWNLGVFICIRCSGVHRGMGTHISRVKSVDLDAWTDEQLQSIVKWGNSRANKYWESKLAPGHIPSEAKIENFIRTKYESKRWVMDGPMPDPSTLDDGDDDVPLAVVQEKAKLQRSASQRTASSSQPLVAHRTRQQQQPAVDLLIGGDNDVASPPARPNTTQPSTRPPPPKEPQAPPKPSRSGDTLIGLDFFGSTQAPTIDRSASPASTRTNSTGMSRPDLKQSILSLYSKPPPAPAQHERSSSFADLASPSTQSSSSKLGGLTDAFSGLSFPSSKAASPPPAKPAEKPSPFASLTSFATAKSTPVAPQVTSRTSSISGGSLFDSLTSPGLPPQPQQRTASVSSNGLGSVFTSPTPANTAQTFQSPPSNDPFGFNSPPPSAPKPTPQPPGWKSQQPDLKSAFNLSKPNPAPPPKADVSAATSTATSMFSANPWGADAWSTPEPAPPVPSKTESIMKVPDTLTANDIGAGWGVPSSSAASKPAPTIAADEDFGGWASAVPTSPGTSTTVATDTTQTVTSSKPAGGFGGADDLFSNVWE
ncbi:hypothetical protein MAP00_007767 [Monascus purpureus]|nr:hypothetical protein MAP00_007767 [Monascus purpureus]